MTTQDVLLGVDVGNTNVKCVALAPALGVIAVASRSTAPARFTIGGQTGELNMERLWRVVCDAIRAVVDDVSSSAPRARLRGIAVASPGFQPVILDSTGHPLLPKQLRSDDGAGTYRRYMDTLGPQQYFRVAGYPLEPHSTPFRVARMREQEPHDFDRIDSVLSISGYLTYRLTGERAFEPTLIGSLGVRDVAAGSFWQPLLADTALSASRFGFEVASGGAVGEVTRSAASASGLPEGMPVFAGAHDYLSAAFAATSWLEHAALDVLGTYEIIATFHNEPQFDAGMSGWRSFIDTDVSGKRYSFMIEAFTGGRMHWFREILGDSPAHEGSPLGATFDRHSSLRTSDLRRLPTYLPGNRSGPNMGALVGLEPWHTTRHILDAVFLGLTFLTVDAFRHQATVAPDIESLCAVGGMSANRRWMQTKSDVLGIPVVVPRIPEATATGAALLAGVGSGTFSGYSDAWSSLSRTAADVYEPNPDRHGTLTDFYKSTYRPLQLNLSGTSTAQT